MKAKIISFPGRPYPLGVSKTGGRINFSLFCRGTDEVSLLIFAANGKRQLRVFHLTPKENRTGELWHIELSGLPPDCGYAYRIAGGDQRLQPTPGLILDPRTPRVIGGEHWGKPAKNWLGGLPNDDGFDWQDDRPPRRPLSETIIYELQVRGFTRHPSAQVKHPGTFAGIIEKIPYLKGLGITAVELLPIAEFNENEIKNLDPETGRTLKNLWGYSPIAYFAPKASLASLPGQQIKEFKALVRALHQAGIEVILDVVFNHTAEGNSRGPILSFKALGNEVYYLVDAERLDYRNFSGCGNTVNCNHPIVRDFILDCLRYWALEMHVDGFRFDLASIMTRGGAGEVLNQPPLVEQIAEDPGLAGVKLIAEPWDASGLYQVGHFSSHPRWAEWNGRFRDDCRAFLAGHQGKTTLMATRMAGSSDLYQHHNRRPANSINFLTSHDGFTLGDLVSYNHKHNLRNGENNRDGDNNNLSWNSGKEGATRSSKVLTLRKRRVRSLATALLLAQGTPMLLAGDEFGRSQGGNNNAYCQDNLTGWIDWRLTEKNRDLLRFFTLLIALRKRYQVFQRQDFFPPPGEKQPPEIIWQGRHRQQEDWSAGNKLLCFTLVGQPKNEPDFFIILSGDLHNLTVELPEATNHQPWRRIIDTSLSSPHDIVLESQAERLASSTLEIKGLAAVVLLAGEARKG